LGLLIGITNFWLVRWCLLSVYPGDERRAAIGVLVAALLPAMLCLCHFVTNEVFAATLATASIGCCLSILRQPMTSAKSHIWLGCLLGATLLAKATGLLLAPCTFGAILWQCLKTPKSERKEPLLHLGLATLVCLLISGWYYLPIYLRYGTPIIGSWDPRLGFSWWQDPGYQTRAYFFQFGDAFTNPWFSGLRSFPAAIYSTLWGDGACSGSVELIYRPPWDHASMALGYALALPIVMATMAGALFAIRDFIRHPTPTWGLLLGFSGIIILALFKFCLNFPYYSHAKAFYGLTALTPVCILSVGAWSWLATRGRWLRLLVGVILALWGTNSIITFWIKGQSVESILTMARAANKSGRHTDAIALARRALELNPQHVDARFWLVQGLCDLGDGNSALKEARMGTAANQSDGFTHLMLASVLARSGNLEVAAATARQAISLESENLQAYDLLARILIAAGKSPEAGEACRAGLSIYPYSAELWSLLVKIRSLNS
jgi:tetratricopeptide (TPR) repeat protein